MEFLKKPVGCFLTLSFLMMQSGCATLISGKKEEVSIKSNPAGAEVTIDGMSMGKTPLNLELKRGRRHEITFTKEGYVEETRATKKGFNWWMMIDVVWGIFAVIPILVDMGSGAAYSVSPDEINVNLQRLDEQAQAASSMVKKAAELPTDQKEKIEKLEELRKSGAISNDDFNRLSEEAMKEKS